MSVKHSLVLFELNGLLCKKIVNKDKKPYYIPQKGLREFLSSFGDEYVLGIFSSSSRKNIKKALFFIDPDKKIKIIIDRKYLSLDPEYKIKENIKQYDTVKNLSVIWSNPLYNSDRKWDKTNTILVDHSPLNVRFNISENIILTEEFKTESGISLTDLRDLIINKLSNLNKI
jgi:hypothetical protein